MSDTMLKIGDLFPKFELENQNGELITNEKIMGEKQYYISTHEITHQRVQQKHVTLEIIYNTLMI